MTQSKDAVGYPYDWSKPDADRQAEYWATHGKKALDEDNPWVNGRLALAAMVWGLIIMLLLSIPAGASGAGKKHPGTKVKAIEQREPEPKKGCLAPVRVVGSQWATEAGAEESAQKAWAEAVRFNAGEAYMDLGNAVGYQKRCGRSSIGEMVGQTLTRCEVDAAPCRPPFTAGASK